jgi:hypothetical protein
MPIVPVGAFRTKWFNVDDSMTSSMLHSAQSCAVKVRCNGEAITSCLHAFCDCDCERSCAYAISSVYLFLVESGGLVHARKQYHAQKWVPMFAVLTHVSTFNPAISAACQGRCIRWRFTIPRRKRQTWRTQIRHTQRRALSSTYPLPFVRMEWTLKAYLTSCVTGWTKRALRCTGLITTEDKDVCMRP